jgi:hypothetical protein
LEKVLAAAALVVVAIRVVLELLVTRVVTRGVVGMMIEVLEMRDEVEEALVVVRDVVVLEEREVVVLLLGAFAQALKHCEYQGLISQQTEPLQILDPFQSIPPPGFNRQQSIMSTETKENIHCCQSVCCAVTTVNNPRNSVVYFIARKSSDATGFLPVSCLAGSRGSSVTLYLLQIATSTSRPKETF